MREGSMWVLWDAGAEDMQLCFKNRRENHRAAGRGVSRREPRAQQHQGFLPCRTTSSMSAMPAPAHLDNLTPRATLAASSRRTKMGASCNPPRAAVKRLGGTREPGSRETKHCRERAGPPRGREAADVASPIHDPLLRVVALSD